MISTEKKRAKKQLVMEERNKQWEREREGKGCFFATLWSGPSTQRKKRKGWVFMTMSILGLYQLFDNFDQR